MICSFYQWPSFEYRGREVLTNKPSIAAYRAPTAPHSTLAIDCQMEEMARAIGVDPIEFRLRHASEAGDPMTHGAPWPTIGLKAVIKAATEHDIWKNRPPSGPGEDGRLHGTGLGVGGWLGGLQPASANVRLNPDGSLGVITGAVDISGTNVAMAQIAAQAYGVPLERVQISTPDTYSAPLAGMSAGSKIIYTVGKAVLEAALDARQQTLTIAAGQLEVSADDLEIVDGQVQVRGASERSVTLEQIGRMTAAYGGKVAPILGRGSISQPRQAPGFSAQVAQVAIDPGTGKMVIERYLCVQDVGYAINPPQVEGQMQGGSTQGIGIGFSEALQFDDQGRLQNPTLLDYRKPTAVDIPTIETAIVEIPSPDGPYGAKGVGEPSIIPGPATLSNAVLDATGVRISEMPITPERIVAALRRKDQGSAGSGNGR
jgi:CO/xanthine dehydrogenase Mo-binding subunit